MFLCAYICKTNANPPDKTPAYKIGIISFKMFSKINSSYTAPTIKDRIATINV